MGQTLIAVACGIYSSEKKLQRGEYQINKSKDKLEFIYEEVHNLKLPICIKQTLLHMVQWDQKDRIPSVSLYQSLKDI